MNPGPDDGRSASQEPFDEVRQAAGEVVDSLKRLLEAAEKVVADPVAFDQIVAGGKGLFEAFTSGYSQEASDPARQPPTDEDQPDTSS